MNIVQSVAIQVNSASTSYTVALRGLVSGHKQMTGRTEIYHRQSSSAAYETKKVKVARA